MRPQDTSGTPRAQRRGRQLEFTMGREPCSRGPSVGLDIPVNLAGPGAAGSPSASMDTTSLALLMAWLPDSPKFFQSWSLIRQGQRQRRRLEDIS